jgi:acyl-CoA synthetase (AMP-forming)/AMP-acid ligase II
MFQNTDLIAKYDLSSVTEVITGAAPMGPVILQKLSDLYPGWKILQGYGKRFFSMLDSIVTPAKRYLPGLTEAGPTVSVTLSDDIWTGSSGTLLPEVQCRLISPDGAEVERYD